jgi:hypothetical protein
MIPTIVIVKDENSSLDKLVPTLKKITRVVERTSFQGETLYSSTTPFFEGVLLYNDKGAIVLKRQDDYTDLLDTLMIEILKLPNSAKVQIKNFFNQKVEATERDKKKFGKAYNQFESYIQQIMLATNEPQV